MLEVEVVIVTDIVEDDDATVGITDIAKGLRFGGVCWDKSDEAEVGVEKV